MHDTPMLQAYVLDIEGDQAAGAVPMLLSGQPQMPTHVCQQPPMSSSWCENHAAAPHQHCTLYRSLFSCFQAD